MYSNWAENQGQLDRMLELERALARQRRQQQWQQLLQHARRLHTALTQPWSWRWWRPRPAYHL